MKTFCLFILISFLTNVTSFCQENFLRELLEFETTDYLDVLIPDSSGVWQVGEPQKQFFNSAYSGRRAIMTDTLQSYPVSMNNCFYLIIDPVNYKWFGYTWCDLEFHHKMDCDTLTEGGYVEISYDKGENWKNIIFDSIYKEIDEWYFAEAHNFYEKDDTLENGIPAFSGHNPEWRHSRFSWGAVGVKKSTIDTILIRFCFQSDSIQTDKDGWMIDNIYIKSTNPSSINSDKQSADVRLFPNPVEDISVIDLSDINHPAQVIFYNYMGKMVFYDRVNNSTYSIARSDFGPGVYYVKLITEDEKVYSGSFVVQ